MRTAFILIKIIAIAIVFPSQALAYSHYTCGEGDNRSRPLFDNSELDVAIYEADFTQDEVDALERSILAWDKQSIGDSELNISIVDTPPLTELAMDEANDIPVALIRAEAKRLAVLETQSSVYMLYKRIPLVARFENSAAYAGTTRHLENFLKCNVAAPETNTLAKFGEIYFSETVNFSGQESYYNTVFPYKTPADINFLATHEMGHVVGLAHTDDLDHNSGWENKDYLPSLMMSGSFMSTHGGTATFNRNLNGNYSYNNRVSLPFAEDRASLRNLYPSNGPELESVGINQYEYGDQWDNQFFAQRLQTLWDKPWFQGDRTNVDLSRGEKFAGHLPITVHNFGTTGEVITGFVRFQGIDSAGNTNGEAGPAHYFSFWVGAGSHTQIASSVKTPSWNKPAGTYALLNYVYDPAGNSEHHYTSTFDASRNTWEID